MEIISRRQNKEEERNMWRGNNCINKRKKKKTFRTQESLEALNIKDRENPARLSAPRDKSFLG